MSAVPPWLWRRDEWRQMHSENGRVPGACSDIRDAEDLPVILLSDIFVKEIAKKLFDAPMLVVQPEAGQPSRIGDILQSIQGHYRSVDLW